VHTLRIGLHLGGFKQDSFLIAGSGALRGDSNGKVFGDLTIGYTPWKYIEAYLALFNASNSNTRTDPGRTDPEVILSLGDLALGLKGRYPVARFMDLGLRLDVKFLNSVSGISFDGSSTNFSADLISSFDLRHAQATRNVPLRFHINFGYLLDNSIKLLPRGQCANSRGNDPCIRSRVVETFAYGIGPQRLRISFAIDAPITIKGIVGLQPFIEYHLNVGVGPGDETVLNALRNDASIPAARLTGKTSQWLTIGLRLRPVVGLILDVGVDVGLQSPGFQYGPPTPPWQVIAGAAYAYDVTAGSGKTKVVTKTITKEISRGPITGRVRGIVRDATTRKPVPNATIKYLNRRESAQLSSEDGTFESYAFIPGGVIMEVSREDYNTMKVETSVSANRETPLEVLLAPKPPSAGQLHGKVHDSLSNAPVTSTVRFTGSTGSVIDADPDGVGSFTAKLPAGDYTMDVIAEGYLAKQRVVVINAGQVQSIDIGLTKKPAASRVSIGKGEILVKGVIHFGTNNADIRPDGQQLLDEVVDVLVRNPQIKKVRIEGHTDNRGVPDKNLALSKARAASVMSYLTKNGVDPLRLESEGYGASQPLVPNLTPANRARNRRVTFKILEQTGG
jgi:outer membrane protein OmpA-like peptidoglycan-associated protein